MMSIFEKAAQRRAFPWLALTLLGATALSGIGSAHAAGVIQPREGDYAAGLTGDGSMMAGNADDGSGAPRAVIWDRYGNMTFIGDLGGAQSYAYDISDNGVVVGTSDTPGGDFEAFRWTQADGVESLGLLFAAGTSNSISATGISDDGTRIVGSSQSLVGSAWTNQAFVWIDGATGGVAGNPEMFELTPGGADTMGEAADISGNGQFVAGTTFGNGGRNATRWSLAGIDSGVAPIAIDLGNLGSNDTNAMAISDDGSVIVGSGETAAGVKHAFRWVASGVGGQMVDLGTLMGNSNSFASAVSGDGTIVVGDADSNAFYWTEADGMVSIADWLDQAGVDVGGNQLFSATDVSDDGSVVIGRMQTAFGDETNYLARITRLTPAPGEIIGMEAVDPSEPISYAAAMNGAGTKVVGSSRYSSSGLMNATLWNADGELTEIDDENAGAGSYATGISEDGEVVVGYVASAAMPGAFRWTEADGIEIIGTLGGNWSQAYGVSGDGSRIVGQARDAAFDRHAFVWVEGATTGVVGNTQMYDLGGMTLPGVETSATAISSDGNFAAGNEFDGSVGAMRWSIADIEAGVVSMTALGGLDGDHSMATGISGDGSVVVGYGNVAGRNHAFRWVEGATGGVSGNEQMYDLGTLLGDNSSAALGVSRDGTIVVGNSYNDLADRNTAIRWTEGTGMVSVADWLADEGVDLGLYHLEDAVDVSDNGRVVTGTMIGANGNPTAYLARVADDEPGPGPGPGQGPGEQPGNSGIMDVAEYHQSLFSSTQIANMGQFLSWLPATGAHHRTLMDTDMEGDICAWANGDFAYHEGDDANIALAEVGACADFMDGQVRAGLAFGKSGAWQDLPLGGSTDLDGQYLLGEVDIQPAGTPFVFSLTGIYGGWDADIRRGYSNGAATDYSNGSTDVRSAMVRARLDWYDALVMGNTSLNPYIALSLGHTEMDGYTETGGAFPARFDAQSQLAGEVRVGVASATQLTPSTLLKASLEIAHRSGDAAVASGEVLGLFDFNLNGGRQNETWARIGLDFDQKLGEATTLSLSVHAATQGEDATLAGALGLRTSF